MHMEGKLNDRKKRDIRYYTLEFHRAQSMNTHCAQAYAFTRHTPYASKLRIQYSQLSKGWRRAPVRVPAANMEPKVLQLHVQYIWTIYTHSIGISRSMHVMQLSMVEIVCLDRCFQRHGNNLPAELSIKIASKLLELFYS